MNMISKIIFLFIFCSSFLFGTNYWNQEDFENPSLNPYVGKRLIFVFTYYEPELISSFIDFCTKNTTEFISNNYQDNLTFDYSFSNELYLKEYELFLNYQEAFKRCISSFIIIKRYNDYKYMNLPSNQIYLPIENPFSLSLKPNVNKFIQDIYRESLLHNEVNFVLKNLKEEINVGNLDEDIQAPFFMGSLLNNLKEMADYAKISYDLSKEIYQINNDEFIILKEKFENLGACKQTDIRKIYSKFCEYSPTYPMISFELEVNINNKVNLVPGKKFSHAIFSNYFKALQTNQKNTQLKETIDKIKLEHNDNVNELKILNENCIDKINYLQLQKVNIDRKRISIYREILEKEMSHDFIFEETYYQNYKNLESICSNLQNVLNTEKTNKEKAISNLNIQNELINKNKIDNLFDNIIKDIIEQKDTAKKRCEIVLANLENKEPKYIPENKILIGDMLDEYIKCIYQNLDMEDKTNINELIYEIDLLLPFFNQIKERDLSNCFEKLNFLKKNMKDYDSFFIQKEIEYCSLILNNFYNFEVETLREEKNRIKKIALEAQVTCNIQYNFNKQNIFNLNARKEIENLIETCIEKIREKIKSSIKIKEEYEYEICNLNTNLKLNFFSKKYSFIDGFEKEFDLKNYDDLKIEYIVPLFDANINDKKLSVIFPPSFLSGNFITINASKTGPTCRINEKHSIIDNILVKEYTINIRNNQNMVKLPTNINCIYESDCAKIVKNNEKTFAIGNFIGCDISVLCFEMDFYNLNITKNFEAIDEDSLRHEILVKIKTNESVSDLKVSLGCVDETYDLFARDGGFNHLKTEKIQNPNCSSGYELIVLSGQIRPGVEKNLIIRYNTNQINHTLKNYYLELKQNECINQDEIDLIMQSDNTDLRKFDLLFRQENSANTQRQRYLTEKIALQTLYQNALKFIGSEETYMRRYNENISLKIKQIQKLIEDLTCQNFNEIRIFRNNIRNIGDICTLATFAKLKDRDTMGCMNIDQRLKEIEEQNIICEDRFDLNLISKCDTLLALLKTQYTSLKIDETSKTIHTSLKDRCDLLKRCEKNCDVACPSISNLENMLELSEEHIDRLKTKVEEEIFYIRSNLKIINDENKQKEVNELLNKITQFYDSKMYSKAIKTSQEALEIIRENQEIKKQDIDYRIYLTIGSSILFIIFCVIIILKNKKQEKIRPKRKISKE